MMDAMSSTSHIERKKASEDFVALESQVLPIEYLDSLRQQWSKKDVPTSDSPNSLQLPEIQVGDDNDVSQKYFESLNERTATDIGFCDRLVQTIPTFRSVCAAAVLQNNILYIAYNQTETRTGRDVKDRFLHACIDRSIYSIVFHKLLEEKAIPEKLQPFVLTAAKEIKERYTTSTSSTMSNTDSVDLVMQFMLDISRNYGTMRCDYDSRPCLRSYIDAAFYIQLHEKGNTFGPLKASTNTDLGVLVMKCIVAQSVLAHYCVRYGEHADGREKNYRNWTLLAEWARNALGIWLQRVDREWKHTNALSVEQGRPLFTIFSSADAIKLASVERVVIFELNKHFKETKRKPLHCEVKLFLGLASIQDLKMDELDFSISKPLCRCCFEFFNWMKERAAVPRLPAWRNKCVGSHSFFLFEF